MFYYLNRQGDAANQSMIKTLKHKSCISNQV